MNGRRATRDAERARERLVHHSITVLPDDASTAVDGNGTYMKPETIARKKREEAAREATRRRRDEAPETILWKAKWTT